MKSLVRSGPAALFAIFVLLVASPWTAAANDRAPRVYRDKIHPHWFADAHGAMNRFWYRLDLAEGAREFVLVDAVAGTRSPAFDHARLAQALGKATGRRFAPDKLPVNSLQFHPQASMVTLRASGMAWNLDLRNYTLTPLDPSEDDGENRLPPSATPHPSPRSDEKTYLRFRNLLPHEVQLCWIDTEGERQSYGTLKPGETRELDTYAGHVWLAADANGDAVAVFKATEEPGLAEIGGKAPPPMRPQPEKTPEKPQAESPRSPDGKWEVTVQNHNLFLRDTQSGAINQLTTGAKPEFSFARDVQGDPPVPQVFWAPDSRHFVAMKFKQGSDRQIHIVQSSPKERLEPRLITQPYLKPGDDVPYAKPHLFSVSSKKEIPIDETLFANPWSIDDVRWSPRSDQFTFLFNQRGHQVLRILAVEAATGRIAPVIDEKSKTFICYSSKFFAGHLDATNEIIWMSERDGWNHLYLYDAATGRVKNQITKGKWVVRGVDRVDEEKRQIWFRAGGIRPQQDPYHVHFCRINFDGSGLTILTEGDGTHSLRYSPDKRFFIDSWSRVDAPPVNELRRSADGSLVCRLEKADISELTAAGWRMPLRFTAKGRDGVTDIHGVIFRPENFDPKKKYPVLEQIYAGPHDSHVPKAFAVSYGCENLLKRGFVVVRIDGMGTSNRSKKFHDVCWKNLQDSGFPDRIPWLRAAAAAHPWMDLPRLGIYGTSAGGQNAMRALLDHGDFYKAAVADCGCHDNRMDKIWWNEQWLGWPVDASYEHASNVIDAHKLQGKMMLMVGETDRNVDPASTMQVVNALIAADKDFELLVMPNVGHGILATPYAARRMEDFFARAFMDAP